MMRPSPGQGPTSAVRVVLRVMTVPQGRGAAAAVPAKAAGPKRLTARAETKARARRGARRPRATASFLGDSAKNRLPAARLIEGSSDDAVLNMETSFPQIVPTRSLADAFAGPPAADSGRSLSSAGRLTRLY